MNSTTSSTILGNFETIEGRHPIPNLPDIASLASDPSFCSSSTAVSSPSSSFIKKIDSNMPGVNTIHVDLQMPNFDCS